MRKKILLIFFSLAFLIASGILYLYRQRQEIRQKIERMPTQITLNFNQKYWLLDLKKLELRYHLTTFWPQKTLKYSLNQEELDRQIAGIATELYQPAVEPAIDLIEGKIVVDYGQNGQELDRDKLKNQLHFQLMQTQTTPIDLALLSLSPALSKEDVDQLYQKALNLIGKTLVLNTPLNQWRLQDRELIKFLRSANLSSWLTTFATTFDHPPENASFQFKENRVALFRPSQNGETLDQTAAFTTITTGIEALIQDATKNQEVVLPVIQTPPAISNASVNTLGIKELLAEGTSYFAHSIPGRIHNLTLAANKLNGLLVAPDEIFSFNQNLGDVSAETGYQPAYIIKEGRTILGDGGGVCQVSTTLFRAVLQAGLPILERHAHAYRVAYYEQKSPVGLDATVFFPTVDLKFKNDTGHYLLLQSSVDNKTQKLTFEIYGTSDGRQVTISTPKIWDQTPPPPDLYQDDPTLPAGQIKQVDWSAWGAKSSFLWKVTRNGEKLQEKTFVSTYRPWQAVYLRGVAPP